MSRHQRVVAAGKGLARHGKVAAARRRGRVREVVEVPINYQLTDYTVKSLFGSQDGRSTY